MSVAVHRFEVYLVNLAPTIGSEIRTTRPCLIISPDEANQYISTVIVAPMTSCVRRYVTRVDCEFDGKVGSVALDQIRAVDKVRLLKRLGRLTVAEQKAVLSTLAEMFAE